MNAIKQGLLMLIFCISNLFTQQSALAARPMMTDDARIVDAKACQLESWTKHNRDNTEYWALPACNPTGNLELTLGGAQTHTASGTRTTDVVLQGKTIIRPLEKNSWGLGFAGGTIRHPMQVSDHRQDWYTYLPTSLSFWNHDLLIHTNVGLLRHADIRKTHLTFGLGSEMHLTEKTWLIAEVFGENGSRPLYQLGLRHWIIPDRWQMDTTFGDRPSNAGSSNQWFSIGIRLLSIPFLP